MRTEIEVRTRQPVHQRESLIEGVDFYYEGGLMVLTARFLLRRGRCCGNDCRHCPYEDTESCESK